MLSFRDHARTVLTHPVIETFLDIKWKKIRKFFFINFAVYFLFLVTYSLLLGKVQWLQMAL